MFEVEFIGAAGEVTGSRHLVRGAESTILLDCGLFQGRRREALARNRDLGLDARGVDAVVLSHAHLDHAGALPLLVRAGFRGSIFATAATRDLCAAMLTDAAFVQAADARYVNKLIARDHAQMDPVEPLYDGADVVRTLERFVAVPYHRALRIAPGVELTFADAGHVLGSAVSTLEFGAGAAKRRLVYSGDLGRRGAPILRDPEVPSGADVILAESTYGGRRHPPVVDAMDRLARIVAETYARGGKVLIPAFALERAQELLYGLHRLQRSGRLPPLPIYVDSPLAIRVTEVFRLHPDCFDEEARTLVTSDRSPFDVAGLSYVSDPDASKAIDADDRPCIVIAASGMCEGGRVVHHLKAMLGSERNAVVIVGYQAQHTLGRRLVERRPKVRIFGVERDVCARVEVLNGFSAHADHDELLAWITDAFAAGGEPRVALVHGEPEAQAALVADLAARGVPDVLQARPGSRLAPAR